MQNKRFKLKVAYIAVAVSLLSSCSAFGKTADNSNTFSVKDTVAYTELSPDEYKSMVNSNAKLTFTNAMTYVSKCGENNSYVSDGYYKFDLKKDRSATPSFDGTSNDFNKALNLYMGSDLSQYICVCIEDAVVKRAFYSSDDVFGVIDVTALTDEILADVSCQIGTYPEVLASATTNSAPTEMEIDFSSVTESGKCGENLTWTLTEKGTLTIIGMGDMYDYNDYGDSMSPWTRNKSIKQVIVGSGITSIGAYAFYDCDMNSVMIGEDVNAINYGSFANCSYLSQIIIPQSVNYGHI